MFISKSDGPYHLLLDGRTIVDPCGLCLVYSSGKTTTGLKWPCKKHRRTVLCEPSSWAIILLHNSDVT